MNTRTQTLVSRLPEGAQAALIHNTSNMRYLSGYTGEGLLVVSAKACAVVTDFRYTEQATREAPDYLVHETSTQKNANAFVLEMLKEAGAECVAIEEGAITYAQYKKLVDDLPGITFVSLARVPEKQREIKDEQEAANVARANAITSQAFDHILGFIKPGVTEKQIAIELERFMLEHDAESIAFDTIVASGPNGSLCHATPGPRAVQPGDLITLDFGARYNGYCADMTRTVALGEISAEQRKVYDTVLEAQKRALAAVHAGMDCKELDAIARDYIDAAGYEGRFGHSLGHSTGLDIHELPGCGTTSTTSLEENMTMTIEPGIYIPGLGGVRIEDSVLVTKEGCKVLTPATKELITLPVK